MTEITHVPRRPASYRDRLTDIPSGLREVATIAWHGLFPPDLREAARIPVAECGLPPAAAGETSVTWVGHATYLIRVGGLNVLTDPVWSNRIPGVRRRLTRPGLAWEELPPIDAVVISHDHYDHLDWPTVRRLPRETPMLVPAGLARWFVRRGFTQVTELDWWESATVGGVSFEFVPAHHWSRRTLFDFCRTLWGGWVIDGSVYFAGDTGYGERLARIGARHPGLDLALMPIGAYQPPWSMEPAHVNPEQAVRAFLDLGAHRMATMHWGTFVLSGEPLMQPLEWTREEWAAQGLSRECLWDLAVGETRSFATDQGRSRKVWTAAPVTESASERIGSSSPRAHSSAWSQ